MTVVVESGSGVIGANAYANAAYVTTYLTTRSRETAWSALTSAQRDSYVVAATDYIEKRWGHRFLGIRQYAFDDVPAIASIVFADAPVADEVLAINDFTYTYKAALSTDSPQGNNFEVLLGSAGADSASNLYDALVASADNAGSTFQTGTVANRHVIGVTLETATIALTSVAPGASGNYNTLTGPLTNVTLTTWAGGIDGGSQALSFPRLGLYNWSGRKVEGVPLKLKQAMAEYADRVRTATLDPDPVFDDQGGSITKLREKVGPIEVETEYSDGTHGRVLIRPYPAADRLLDEYVQPAGVIRA